MCRGASAITIHYGNLGHELDARHLRGCALVGHENCGTGVPLPSGTCAARRRAGTKAVGCAIRMAAPSVAIQDREMSLRVEKSCPIPKTHTRLRQTHDLWHEMQLAYPDADLFVTKLNA